MNALSSRWSERRRVLAYSAVAALAFIALERLELALFDLAGPDNVFAGSRGAAADRRLAAEAAEVAARSRDVVASLPSGHRLAAFRLGYEIGWASEFVGSFAMSERAVQQKAAAIADAHVALAREQARRIGIDAGDVAAMPSRTLADFLRLEERFEADESGLAGRVEARLSPMHRHLFLLGASVGSDAAKVQGSGGKFAGAQVAAIRRHATLAGLAPAAWQPLAAEHRGVSPAQVLERHRVALDGLVAALGDGAPVAPRDDASR